MIRPTLPRRRASGFGVPRERAGGHEIWALILLLIGGVVLPVVGWIIGVVLLWSSRVWTTREKLAGTFLFPFGLLLPVALLLGAAGVRECSGAIVNGQVVDQTCSRPSVLYEALAIVGLAVLVVVPIVTTVILARRMRARTAPA